jgi:hypothetical protein
MLKPPAEDTGLTRPGNERVRPSLSWRNATKALHTRRRLSGFCSSANRRLHQAVVLAGSWCDPEPVDSYIVLIPFVSAYLIYDRRKGLPKEYGFSSWAMIPLLAGIIALTTALKLHQPGPDLQCRRGFARLVFCSQGTRMLHRVNKLVYVVKIAA